jgi:hypothetical protein
VSLDGTVQLERPLRQALAQLERALLILDECDAPVEIGSLLDLAIARTKQRLRSIDMSPANEAVVGSNGVGPVQAEAEPACPWNVRPF